MISAISPDLIWFAAIVTIIMAGFLAATPE
jgi:hypothetical protein